MTEATRAWIYRILVLALLAYVVVTQPDTLKTILPVLIGLAGNGLATVYTRTRREN